MKHFTILITGCSTGIGRALALALHQKGHTVIATARQIQRIEDLKSQGLHIQALDVNNASSIDAALNYAENTCGGIDMLINNAGYGLMGPLAELPIDQVRAQFETNVFAPLVLIQKVLPGMLKKGGGRLVNVGSIVGHVSTPFLGAYCATKAAIRRWNDALRMELKPFNIDVIMIEPGGVLTEFGHNATGSMEIEEFQLYKNYQKNILKRAKRSLKSRTTAKEFANYMAKRLDAEHPSALLRYGDGSFLLPLFAKILPIRWIDAIMRRAFGLS